MRLLIGDRLNFRFVRGVIFLEPGRFSVVAVSSLLSDLVLKVEEGGGVWRNEISSLGDVWLSKIPF